MSNIDKIGAKKQLFTELTPEEGAVVEGGIGVLHIHKIKAINAGADFSWPFGNPDDTYIEVDGLQVWGTNAMNNNDVRIVNFTDVYVGSIDVQLWDKDWGPDDFLGGFTAQPGDNFLDAPRIVDGSGSKYAVYYSA